MWRKLKVWWCMMANIGPSMRLGRQADRLYRYYVLKALADDGLFDYLKEPRTYGQILAEFGYADIDYTRGLFDILVSDKQNVITREGNLYRRTAEPLPDLETIIGQTARHIRTFLVLADGMSRNIPKRLRREPVELLESFEEEGRQLLSKLDKLLGDRIYATMREAVFALLAREDFELMRGRDLLEVGCGSGRETAHVWLKLGGQTRITGVDAVPGVLQMAEQSFEALVKEMNPHHPPITAANRPVFREASVTNLPFEDNSFDAALSLFLLHWTADPQQGINELVRVVKPGGLIFGAQAFKPLANPYFDLVFRTSENVHGFFWKEDFLRWFSQHGVIPEVLTPAGVFRARLPGG